MCSEPMTKALDTFLVTQGGGRPTDVSISKISILSMQEVELSLQLGLNGELRREQHVLLHAERPPALKLHRILLQQSRPS